MIYALCRYLEAAEDCDTALLKDPFLYKIRLRAGKARLQLGLFNKAEDDFNNVLSGLCSDSSVITEARERMRNIITTRDCMNDMCRYESLGNFDKALASAEKLLSISSHCLVAHVVKCKALCSLRRYEEAKDHIEGTILGQTHVTILKLQAHESAIFPPPSGTLLHLSTTKRLLVNDSGFKLNISTTALAEAILCLGSELGKVYLTAIKNSSACHTCCTEVMESVAVILGHLAVRLREKNGGLSWPWVSIAAAVMRSLLEQKKLADRLFRESAWGDAVLAYGTALKVGIHFLF